VHVHAVELLELDGPRARLKIDCGKGVYIRAIARDLGELLGCGAYCSALTRTRIGPFTLETAAPPEALTRENLSGHLLPARLAVAEWPQVELGDLQIADILNGKAIPAPAAFPPGARIAAVDGTGRLIALCEFAAPMLLLPRRVFAPTA
jgi:tRNA pseudouridine55 synthase